MLTELSVWRFRKKSSVNTSYSSLSLDLKGLMTFPQLDTMFSRISDELLQASRFLSSKRLLNLKQKSMSEKVSSSSSSVHSEHDKNEELIVRMQALKSSLAKELLGGRVEAASSLTLVPKRDTSSPSIRSK